MRRTTRWNGEARAAAGVHRLTRVLLRSAWAALLLLQIGCATSPAAPERTGSGYRLEGAPVSEPGEGGACTGWSPTAEAVADYFRRAVQVSREESQNYFAHVPCELRGHTRERGRERGQWTINRGGTAVSVDAGGTRYLACDTCTALFGDAGGPLVLWPADARFVHVRQEGADPNDASCSPVPAAEALNAALHRAEPVRYLRYSRQLPKSDCHYSGALLSAQGERIGQWALESAGRVMVWLDVDDIGPLFFHCRECLVIMKPAASA